MRLLALLQVLDISFNLISPLNFDEMSLEEQVDATKWSYKGFVFQSVKEP